MQRIFTNIIRVFISVVFLFSGFVKLIDPLGTSYKFEEYFQIFHLNFLIPYALAFSVILILTESMVGFTLLFGYQIKITTKLLLYINILFLFLAGYSAFYNKVTDCGCFGDAIKLTPWQTFYKNIFLTVFSIYLYLKQKDMFPFTKHFILRWVTLIVFCSNLYLGFYVLRHLPIIDFRAYAVGKSIVKGIENKVIHDFFLESDLTGEDFTSSVLGGEKVLLLVVYDLDKSDERGFEKVRKKLVEAQKQGYLVYGLSASSTEKVERIKRKYRLEVDFLFCDGIPLKTMIRSNPGIITLSKGVVIHKWAWRDL